MLLAEGVLCLDEGSSCRFSPPTQHDRSLVASELSAQRQRKSVPAHKNTGASAAHLRNEAPSRTLTTKRVPRVFLRGIFLCSPLAREGLRRPTDLLYWYYSAGLDNACVFFIAHVARSLNPL